MSASIWNPGTAVLAPEAGQLLTNADGTGVVDSTAAWYALLHYCIPRKLKAVIPGGTYLVSGTLADAVYAEGSLYIECLGEVIINVSASSTPFSILIPCNTTAINNSVISGGRLVLNLNNVCANGVYLRHSGGTGGTVLWGPITVTNAKNTFDVDEENQGLLVYGKYVDVTINNAIINGVDRVRNPSGVCKGISVSEIMGQVTINSPHVSNVMAGPGASQDADAIAVFGFDSALNPALLYRREGNCQINNPVIVDPQGRAIKLQVGQSEVNNPRVYRKNVVSFATADIDAQIGGVHTINNPVIEWRKNGAVSPVAAGSYPIALQCKSPDKENIMQVIGGVFSSEILADKIVSVISGASAAATSVRVSDLICTPLAGLTAPMGTRGIVDVSVTDIQTATGNLHLTVNGVRASQSGAPIIGYVSNTANASKFSFDAYDNVNTAADNANSSVLGKNSGTTITQVNKFSLRDNTGFRDFLDAWVFDTRALAVGTRFTYTRATSTVTNGPVIAAGTYCDVECLGLGFSGNRKVRITVDNAGTMTCHYTQSGVWGTI